MDKEKSNIPSWLQDKKKLLIIVIVIILMIVSTFTQAIVGISVANAVNNKLEEYGINISIKDQISDLFGTHLSGEYQNDYADETLIFKANGKLTYKAAGYEADGTYSFDGSKLVLVINFDSIEFDIVEFNSTQLIICNDYGFYSYTKLK